jgi:hypothetical protein
MIGKLFSSLALEHETSANHEVEAAETGLQLVATVVCVVVAIVLITLVIIYKHLIKDQDKTSQDKFVSYELQETRMKIQVQLLVDQLNSGRIPQRNEFEELKKCDTRYHVQRFTTQRGFAHRQFNRFLLYVLRRRVRVSECA